VEQAACRKVTSSTVAKARASFPGIVLVLAGFTTVSAEIELSACLVDPELSDDNPVSQAGGSGAI